MAKQKPKKIASKQTTTQKNRVKKQLTYKNFKLAKRIKPTHKKPIPGIYGLFKKAASLLKHNKKLFIGIIAVYIFLSVLLVSGLSLFSEFVNTRTQIDELFGNDVGHLTKSLALLGYLVSAGSSSISDSGSVYQMLLLIVISLVLIWSMRQVYAGEKVSSKQSFYQGLFPLAPFVLVILVILLQLVPFLFGNFIFQTVLVNSLAVTFAEKSLFFLFFLLLSLLSLYMLISSIFALYIVTLPDMTPMKALKSARGLVMHRRISIVLRLIGLPIIIAVFFIAIALPIIYFLPSIAVPVFIFLSSMILFFSHAYLYNLYRSLL